MQKTDFCGNPRRIFWQWFCVFIVMSAIFAFSCLPGNNIPKIFNFQDTVFHVTAYGCLAYFFARALRGSAGNMRLLSLIVFSVLFGLTYGVSDEWHQLFVPNRSVSGLDILFDGIGSLAGSILLK